MSESVCFILEIKFCVKLNAVVEEQKHKFVIKPTNCFILAELLICF